MRAGTAQQQTLNKATSRTLQFNGGVSISSSYCFFFLLLPPPLQCSLHPSLGIQVCPVAHYRVERAWCARTYRGVGREFQQDPRHGAARAQGLDSNSIITARVVILVGSGGRKWRFHLGSSWWVLYAKVVLASVITSKVWRTSIQGAPTVGHSLSLLPGVRATRTLEQCLSKGRQAPTSFLRGIPGLFSLRRLYKQLHEPAIHRRILVPIRSCPMFYLPERRTESLMQCDIGH